MYTFIWYITHISCICMIKKIISHNYCPLLKKCESAALSIEIIKDSNDNCFCGNLYVVPSCDEDVVVKQAAEY